ncbi:GNAT family protein [Bacillaceae bacterium S4-13-58]
MIGEIHTNRIVVFPLGNEDGVMLQRDTYNWYQSRKIKYHEEWPDDALLANLPFYLEKLEKDPTHFGLGPWVIYSKLENTVVGHIGFHGLVKKKELELGYYICPSFRKCGYIKEAIPLLLDWAKSKGYQKIHAQCDISNIISQRILRTFGFLQIKQEKSILHFIKELNK